MFSKRGYLAVCIIIAAAFAVLAYSYDSNSRFALSSDSNSVLSPSKHIPAEQLKVFSDKAIIEKDNLIWARIKDTHSMEPTLNKNSISLEILPGSESEINIGDIISYEQNLQNSGYDLNYNSKYDSIIIIHRVIEIGNDKDGWFAVTKGDNNKEPDNSKVRFNQIKGLVVGILY